MHKVSRVDESSKARPPKTSLHSDNHSATSSKPRHQTLQLLLRANHIVLTINSVLPRHLVASVLGKMPKAPKVPQFPLNGLVGIEKPSGPTS